MKQNNFVRVAILLALIVTACASPTPAPVITVVLPTAIMPTQPPPTIAPTPTPAPTAAPAPTAQRINFQTGQFNTTVQGKLAANGMDKWILRIIAGQTLSANLIPTNGKAKLTIAGADGTVLISDHADAMTWNGKIPTTQDYTITILAFDNTAPSYTMQITIPPLAQPTIAPTIAPKRIAFAPGAISATVQGVTHAVDSDRWIIAAQVGQTISVNLVVPPGGRAALVIYGVDGTVLISDHASAMRWSGQLPKTQDYNIHVKPENGVVSYSMTVTIPPR
jgi:hypothetical protein